MVAWSSVTKPSLVTNQIRRLLFAKKSLNSGNNGATVMQTRWSGSGHGKEFIITASRFHMHKFKDLVHFYGLTAFLFFGGIVFLVNLYIAPAKLAPIPEGYEPEEWEYYSHPITRFIQKYLLVKEQENHERLCHLLFEESMKQSLRKLEYQVKDAASRNDDYKTFFYTTPEVRYLRKNKELKDENELKWGGVRIAW